MDAAAAALMFVRSFVRSFVRCGVAAVAALPPRGTGKVDTDHVKISIISAAFLLSFVASPLRRSLSSGWTYGRTADARRTGGRYTLAGS